MKSSISLLLLFFLLGCNIASKKEATTNLQKQYKLTGTLFDHNEELLFLYVYRSNKVQKKDSTRIENNQFYFLDRLDVPVKAALQLKNHTRYFSFILANDSMHIEMNTTDYAKSKIKHSPINSKLAAVQKKSAQIYRKIDYLYPQLQKARIENDVESLQNINRQIQLIIDQNQAFLYNYISRNPNDYLAALLLNDLWHTKDKDSIQLQKLALQLHPEVQKALDFAIH